MNHNKKHLVQQQRSRMKISKEFCWNISFKLLCIIGCMYQIHSVVLSYLIYETVTQIKFYEPTHVRPPTLNYCFFAMMNAMNHSEIVNKYKVKIPNNYEDATEFLEDTVTISDIIKYSPDTIIDECKFRDASGLSLIEIFNRKECGENFVTKKYVNQQYLCYQSTLKRSKLFALRSVADSLHYEKAMYDIRFRRHLADYNKIRLALTSGGHPHISQTYSFSYYKDSRDRISLHVHCVNFTVTMLGYPFDKFECEKNSEYFDCIDNCLTNLTYKTYKRMPYTLFLDQSINIKMISARMLQNFTVADSLNKFHSKCKMLCPMFPCKHSYCITSGYANNAIQLGRSKPGSSIRVESSSSPDVNVQNFPKVTLLDMMIYIFSSLGIWFGFVIISFDPCERMKNIINFISNNYQRKVSDKINVDKHPNVTRRKIEGQCYNELYVKNRTKV